MLQCAAMKTTGELSEYLATVDDAPTGYKIAVGSLLFTPDDKLLLLERGAEARAARGKLEGVGGGVDDGETDLEASLLREIHEEIGDDVDVTIDKMLSVKVLPGETYPWWVVVDYLGRIASGTPRIMEPHKCAALHYVDLAEVDSDRLSRFQRVAMGTYRTIYGDRPYYLQPDSAGLPPTR
jgi:8-oxo-dGTP pyrophosphatase MutT (NUDIX family)